MSDNDLHYDSDEYHEDDYHDLHRDDSLPDLVLSSSTIRDSDPDLLEPPADLESEYFSTSEQVNTSVCSRNGNIRSTLPRILIEYLLDVGAWSYSVFDNVIRSHSELLINSLNDSLKK